MSFAAAVLALLPPGAATHRCAVRPPAVLAASRLTGSDPVLQTVPFAVLGARSAGRTGKVAAAGPAVVPSRATRPFSMLGVTWTDPAAEVPGRVEVRARSASSGRWGSWQTLESDGSQPGDARGSTDPVWVGRSDGVQARVVGGGLVPAGLRVDLINTDPGSPDPAAASPAPAAAYPTAAAASPAAAAASPAAAAAAAASPTPALGGSSEAAGSDIFARSSTKRDAVARTAVSLPARPIPRMITRAGWGANEAIVKHAPTYTGATQVFFVHHTATGNSYSCAQSASIVRGIQAYQVRSKGWDDIGYNFLVDKCGTLFEGRGGGVNRPVLGSHTLGFNTDASAIAVIGNYDKVPVSRQVETAVATVAAYKLGARESSAAARVKVSSRGGNRYAQGARADLYRISGHRDAGRTECPGDDLYAQLPAIRAIAGAAPSGLAFQHMYGATKVGSVVYTRGTVKPLWSVATPSALIARFEVWLDGRLVQAVPGTHRGAVVPVPAGRHALSIRAVHLNGRAGTINATVYSDAAPPALAADAAFTPGSLGTDTIPVRLGWAASDPYGVASVRLIRPVSANLGPIAHHRTSVIPIGVPTTYALQAADRAGNVAGTTVTRTPGISSEATTRRTGSWRAVRNPAYLGGTALLGSTAGTSATWTFTGRSAAVVVGRGALSGRLHIYVDGVDAGLVDVQSPTTRYRQAIWTRGWGSSGPHTVRVVLEGTAGRPGVVLDGLAYLQ